MNEMTNKNILNNDYKEQTVEDDRIIKMKPLEKCLKSIVKIYAQVAAPNYSMPWQMKRQKLVTGSGFIIENKQILTNGHVIAYAKSIRINKHGDAKKYIGRVIHVAHECDVAILSIDDDTFWEDLEPLEFGPTPNLEECVIVAGYPSGGENICVTRGIVSRVDVTTYAHSGVNLLTIQIDAAINPGNSGGPALLDGKVAGIAFEAMDNAENIGFIIPTEIIQRFIKEILVRGKFHGFCSLGIKCQTLDNENLRHYLNLPTDQNGVLVIDVYPLGCSNEIIKKGDVLCKIDEHQLADDGTVFFRKNQRISWEYLISKHMSTDDISVQIFRSSQLIQLSIKLSQLPQLVPSYLYDISPRYLVIFGLVFVELSQPYLDNQYGKDWTCKAPIHLCDKALYSYKSQIDEEVVILSQVLSSELTSGYESFSNILLKSINAIKIISLHQLSIIFNSIIKNYKDSININNNVDNEKRFLIVELDRGYILALDIESGLKSMPVILDQYKIDKYSSSHFKLLELDNFTVL